MIIKRRFSRLFRALFIAGLEGTGHHAFHSVFKACNSDGRGLCGVDHGISRLLYYSASTIPPRGIFHYGTNEPGEAMEQRRSNFRKQLSALRANSSELLLFLNGASVSRSEQSFTGELSYPNFGGAEKHLHHPDLRVLATLAETAEVDLRVLVLLRDVPSILHSTAKRQIGATSKHEAAVLSSNADALAAQMLSIDPRFILCCEFDDFGSQNKTWERVAPFLHGRLTEGTVRQQIAARMHPPPPPKARVTNSITTSTDNGRLRLRRPLTAHERQLESAFQRLRHVCER